MNAATTWVAIQCFESIEGWRIRYLVHALKDRSEAVVGEMFGSLSRGPSFVRLPLWARQYVRGRSRRQCARYFAECGDNPGVHHAIGNAMDCPNYDIRVRT
jgi:hypothetical protein